MARTTFFRLTGWPALLSLTLFGGLSAQDQKNAQPVSGPVMGYVADGLSGIRPILGIAGAASLGASILPNPGLRLVAFSALRDYALGLTPRSRQIVLLRNLRTSASTIELQAPPGANRVAISRSGSAAVLYYPQTQSVSVLWGLPQSPAVYWSLEASNLAGGLAALAVSDDGGAVLAATAGEPGSAWLLTPEGSSRFVAPVAGAPSLAFLAGSHDAVIADGALGTVTLVRDANGQAQGTTIGGEPEGVSSPIALAVAPDNRHVLVANAGTAGIVSLSLGGEQPQAIPCPCTVTGLEALADGSTFRLNEPGEGPIWLLDAASSPPRVVFVPDQSPARPRLQHWPPPVHLGGER